MWPVQSASFIIVDDQKANIIRRNFLSKTDIALVQEKPKHNQILNVQERENSDEEIKQWVKESFQQVCV